MGTFGLWVFGAFIAVFVLFAVFGTINGKALEKRLAQAHAQLRAKAKVQGWLVRVHDDPSKTLDWTIDGTTTSGLRFKAEHHFNNAPSSDDASAECDSIVVVCSALRSPSAVFLLARREGIEFSRGKLGAMLTKKAVGFAGGVSRSLGLASGQEVSEAEDVARLVQDGDLVSPASGLGERWRLVSRDVALARHVFDVDLTATLRDLYRDKPIGRDSDSRLWIDYGPRGLSVTLGFVAMKGDVREPRLLDLALSIVEHIEAKLQTYPVPLAASR